MNAVNQVPLNSLLLFEDIDCMKSSQTRTEEKRNQNAASAPSEGEHVHAEYRHAFWSAECARRLLRTNRCAVCNDHEPYREAG
jgi:hypothetical protein